MGCRLHLGWSSWGSLRVSCRDMGFRLHWEEHGEQQEQQKEKQGDKEGLGRGENLTSPT